MEITMVPLELKLAIYHGAVEFWVLTGFFRGLLCLSVLTLEFHYTIDSIGWRVSDTGIKRSTKPALFLVNTKATSCGFKHWMPIRLHVLHIGHVCFILILFPQASSLGRINIGLGYMQNCTVFCVCNSTFLHFEPVIRQRRASYYWVLLAWLLVFFFKSILCCAVRVRFSRMSSLVLSSILISEDRSVGKLVQWSIVPCLPAK